MPLIASPLLPATMGDNVLPRVEPAPGTIGRGGLSRPALAGRTSASTLGGPDQKIVSPSDTVRA